MNFYELMVIGIVAIVVFGPEKMPQLAYRVARYFKMWQHISDKVRQEINNQLHLEEMKQTKQKTIENLDKILATPESKEEPPKHE